MIALPKETLVLKGFSPAAIERLNHRDCSRICFVWRLPLLLLLVVVMFCVNAALKAANGLMTKTFRFGGSKSDLFQVADSPASLP